MGLFVGSTPVKSVYVGSTPVQAVYVGSELVWSATVQIALGTGNQARDQLRASLAARGLNYQTVQEIPFDIELVGTGSIQDMFRDCAALTSAPDMDTSQVTNMRDMFSNCPSLTHVPDLDTAQVTDMRGMFYYCPSLTHAPVMDTSSVTDMAYTFCYCSSLTSVPDMDTAQVTDTSYMLYSCSALTDGNVRLIGRHPNVTTNSMIANSGLTREPWYTADGQPWPTAEVHEVSLTNVVGNGTVHPLLTVTVPAGETWDVRIQGTVTTESSLSSAQPRFRIGVSDSGTYGQGAAVDFSGTVTAANSTIALVTSSYNRTSFTGTVTIEK